MSLPDSNSIIRASAPSLADGEQHQEGPGDDGAAGGGRGQSVWGEGEYLFGLGGWVRGVEG